MSKPGPDNNDNGPTPDQSPPSPRYALAIWAATIFILSVGPATPGMFSVSDKIMHAAFYAPLGSLVFWTLTSDSKLKKWAIAALVVFLFGFFIELVQAFLPWRQFDWIDAIANLAGGAVGAFFALCFPRLYLISIFK